MGQESLMYHLVCHLFALKTFLSFLALYFSLLLQFWTIIHRQKNEQVMYTSSILVHQQAAKSRLRQQQEVAIQCSNAIPPEIALVANQARIGFSNGLVVDTKQLTVQELSTGG
jgi:hypothetical protein